MTEVALACLIVIHVMHALGPCGVEIVHSGGGESDQLQVGGIVHDRVRRRKVHMDHAPHRGQHPSPESPRGMRQNHLQSLIHCID